MAFGRCIPSTRTKAIGAKRGKPRGYKESQMTKKFHVDFMNQLKENDLFTDRTRALDVASGSGRFMKDYLSHIYQKIDFVDADPQAVRQTLHRN